MDEHVNTSPVQAKAMLFCRRVLQDRLSGLPTLIDVVGQLTVPHLPIRLQGLGVFCELTGCRGEYQFELYIADSATGNVAGPMKAPRVKWEDATAYNHISIMMNFAAEHEGDYEFRLFANGQFVDQKVLHVRIVPPKGPMPFGIEPS